MFWYLKTTVLVNFDCRLYKVTTLTGESTLNRKNLHVRLNFYYDVNQSIQRYQEVVLLRKVMYKYRGKMQR